MTQPKKTHLAVAAALAALALPALASDSLVCGDPAVVECASPTPAVALHGSSGLATVRSDPTFPPVTAVAPATALQPRASNGPAINPEDNTPKAPVALVPGAAPAEPRHLAGR